MKRITLASSVLVLVASLSGCATEATDEEGLIQSSDESSLQAIPPGRPDLRIAVVGAGPSGLTAAYTLKGLGYTNVTVFEREDHVGGKVNSLALGDVRAELGAVFASPDYRVVLGLANELGVPYVQYDVPRFILDEDGVKRTFSEFLRAHYTVPEIQASIAAYAGVLAQFPEIEQDGFVGIHPDLHQPFDQFATQYGIQPIAQMAKSLFVGFGYGYYEEIPAIYALKLIPWLVKLGGPEGIQSPPYYVFPTGYQSVWTAVASQLNVRLNATVTKVERSNGNGPIRVTINTFERKDFDAVIVSAPLSSVPKFVVLSYAEKALFAKVETIRYFVSLFAAANLTQGETNFVQGNSKPSGINHVIAWGNPGGNLPIFIGYQIASKSIPAALVSATLILDILHLGRGVASPPLIRKEWPEYFPHVKTAAMRAGFFRQVDALQGNRGLFYTGGSLSFETVEHAARHGQSLVEEYFPAN